MYDMLRKYMEGGKMYEHGGVHEGDPQIDIEFKKVMTGKDQDGNPIYKNESQFFVEGKPVSSEDASYFYNRSQEGVQGGRNFNDFVQDYSKRYYDERFGGRTGLGPTQTRSRVAKKKESGVTGLMEALKNYGQAPSNMSFEE